MRKELATAYHELGVMMDAGLPIIRALSTAGKGFKGRISRVFGNVRDGVQQGQTLYEAMAAQKFFPKMDLMTVQAAENSGNLGECFEMLSQWHSFVRRMGSYVISGMAYPLFIIHAMALVLSLVRVTRSSGLDILGIFSGMFWILLPFYVIAAVFYLAIKYTPETGLPRRILDRFVLWFPGLGGALKRLALARYCKTFYMLYKAGVPMVETAKLAPMAMGNVIVADLVRRGADSAAAGEDVSKGFSKNLPPEFLELWTVGEESGELEKVTKKLGEVFADSGEFRLKEFCTWFPRIVYFVLLIVVAIFVIWFYTSMYAGIIGGYG